MRGDGDGWVVGSHGVRRWGKHGAAGLLLRSPDASGAPTVLLQHRAQWCHHGDTWGLPGGARDSHETEIHAALREAEEETGISRKHVRVRARVATGEDVPGWEYTTVVADIARQMPAVGNSESIALAWVPESQVKGYRLHPGLAETWPKLELTQIRLIVDSANVVGARANGWWRDRAGATLAFAQELQHAFPVTCPLPGGGFGWVNGAELVVEGQARGAIEKFDDTGVVTMFAADGIGDDHIVERAKRSADGSAADGSATNRVTTVVVSADRGLKERLPGDVRVLGPKTILAWLAASGS
ncbi:NUDIX domain-containing protein [Hoyosella rhizosphaerae]|nr:NUDIX domain-containing protein [Hoyosella rhizosphaerae]MBN4927759.1 NUDIX domain-containing protein [Hoyosella rhizosphaerae]